MPQSEFEYIALASQELAALDTSWFPGDIVKSGLAGDSRAAWALGELTSVGAAAQRVGANLIHSPANIGPWTGRTPLVLTVHDLLPFRHPEFVPGHYSGLLRSLVRGSARHARRMLTISEQTGFDLQSVLKLDTNVIDVVPLAGSKVHDASVAKRQPRLLLALGNRLPHKNFTTLIKAIALLPEAQRPRLVITGSHGLDPLAALVSELGLERWVDLKAWLAQSEIETLYSEATAVVVPSLFEGFGLPVLESMARGCPVLCSDIPVLREVAGDAAAFFAPLSARSIAEKVAEVLGDPNRLRDLTAAGIQRARRYSWERTALGTAETFRRALE